MLVLRNTKLLLFAGNVNGENCNCSLEIINALASILEHAFYAYVVGILEIYCILENTCRRVGFLLFIWY